MATALHYRLGSVLKQLSKHWIIIYWDSSGRTKRFSIRAFPSPGAYTGDWNSLFSVCNANICITSSTFSRKNTLYKCPLTHSFRSTCIGGMKNYPHLTKMAAATCKASTFNTFSRSFPCSPRPVYYALDTDQLGEAVDTDIMGGNNELPRTLSE